VAREVGPGVPEGNTLKSNHPRAGWEIKHQPSGSHLPAQRTVIIPVHNSTETSPYETHETSYSASSCECVVALGFYPTDGFLSSQGHHAGLCELMGRFGQSLLDETDPPISGLDKSVLIPPRRLHLTLGVMSLGSTTSADRTEGTTDPIQPRTLDDAVRFLESLKPRLDSLLRASAPGSIDQAQKIRLALNSMDTMKLEKGGAAHVLWVGPKDGNSKDITDEETNKLRQVCGEFCDLLQ